MQKIDVNKEVEEFLENNPERFAILIYGSFEQDKQGVAVEFFKTPIRNIEPALGYAMHHSDIMLKGVLGGINSEFEYYRGQSGEQLPQDEQK